MTAPSSGQSAKQAPQGPITLNVGQFAAAFKAREYIRVAYLRDAVRQAAVDGVPALTKALPKDLGGLQRSVRVEFSDTGTEVARLLDETPYARANEYGTRPFTPPLNAIKAWVGRHAGKLASVPTKNKQRLRSNQRLLAALNDVRQAVRDVKSLTRFVARRNKIRFRMGPQEQNHSGGFAGEQLVDAVGRVAEADRLSDRLAGAIWSHIRKNGIRASFPMRNAQPKLKKILGTALRRAIREMKKI